MNKGQFASPTIGAAPCLGLGRSCGLDYLETDKAVDQARWHRGAFALCKAGARRDGL